MDNNDKQQPPATTTKTLLSWTSYRKTQGISSPSRVRPHRFLINEGFSSYGDCLDSSSYVAKGETPVVAAKRLHAELQQCKPIDPADPRVIYVVRDNQLGEYIDLYYKFKRREEVTFPLS